MHEKEGREKGNEQVWKSELPKMCLWRTNKPSVVGVKSDLVGAKPGASCWMKSGRVGVKPALLVGLKKRRCLTTIECWSETRCDPAAVRCSLYFSYMLGGVPPQLIG